VQGQTKCLQIHVKICSTLSRSCLGQRWKVYWSHWQTCVWLELFSWDHGNEFKLVSFNLFKFQGFTRGSQMLDMELCYGIWMKFF